MASMNAFLRLIDCMAETAYELNREKGFDVQDIGSALIAAGAGFLKAELSPGIAALALTEARRAVLEDLDNDQAEAIKADIARYMADVSWSTPVGTA